MIPFTKRLIANNIPVRKAVKKVVCRSKYKTLTEAMNSVNI